MTKEQWQQTAAYAALKQRLLARQEDRCGDCGNQEALELHHDIYPQEHMTAYRIGGDWGDEEDEDCVCLCRSCHLGRHLDPNGDFWAIPSEMRDAWGRDAL